MSLPLHTRVLVVDDFESMRRIVRQVLNEIGFRDVTLAEDGHTALELLRDGDFGFLVTDWNIPGMAGIDLVRAVRADARLKGLPILMVSAEATRERIVQAIQSGVSDYLVKPFTRATLKTKMERIFIAVAPGR